MYNPISHNWTLWGRGDTTYVNDFQINWLCPFRLSSTVVATHCVIFRSAAVPHPLCNETYIVSKVPYYNYFESPKVLREDLCAAGFHSSLRLHFTPRTPLILRPHPSRCWPDDHRGRGGEVGSGLNKTAQCLFKQLLRHWPNGNAPAVVEIRIQMQSVMKGTLRNSFWIMYWNTT